MPNSQAQIKIVMIANTKYFGCLLIVKGQPVKLLRQTNKLMAAKHAVPDRDALENMGVIN